MLGVILRSFFALIVIAGAVHSRAHSGRHAHASWRWLWMPLALGSLVLPALPLPIWAWGVASWAIGMAPAWYVAKRGWDDLVPWADWFGPSKYLSGSRQLMAWQVARAVRKQASRFQIGGVPFPAELEVVHALLVGTTGSGKTVVLKTVLDQMEKDGQRVIAIDSGADLATRYYSAERGDVILNPLDSRCAPWSPLAELRSVEDCMSMAKSICPTGEGSDKTWTLAAQNFISAILMKLLERPGATNKDFLHFVAIADVEELREFLAGTHAAPYLAEGNERMFGSVRSTAQERTAAFFMLDPSAGRDGFSVRKFIAADGQSWLFATYLDDQLELLRYLIATIIDIAAIAVLSLTQSAQRRVMFSLDEFDSIGKVDTVLTELTKGRKYGASVWLGIQTIAQFRKNYGNDGAQTLAGNLGSWVVLRTPDPDTAEYVSKKLGTGDYARKTMQLSHSEGGMGTSHGEQIERNIPAVPTGDIVTLQVASRETKTPPMGYLHLAGQMPCKITLSFPAGRPERDSDDALGLYGFVLRNDYAQQRARAAGVLHQAQDAMSQALASINDI